MYIGSLTTTDILQHDGVETGFGVRSRRRNRPLLARLIDRHKGNRCDFVSPTSFGSIHPYLDRGQPWCSMFELVWPSCVSGSCRPSHP